MDSIACLRGRRGTLNHFMMRREGRILRSATLSIDTFVQLNCPAVLV
jgi:hypothetical protein